MKIVRGTKFKKDFKKYINSPQILKEFQKILEILVSGKKLPLKYRDHSLKGNYSKFRECHIRPDLLLVYEIDKEELVLYLFRIGTHSEIF